MRAPDRSKGSQACRNGMRRGHLAVLVLQDVTHCPLQDVAGSTARRVGLNLAACSPEGVAFARRLRHRSFCCGWIIQERMKWSDRVGSTTDTARSVDPGDPTSPPKLQESVRGFSPDDTLEIAHHKRIRMRSPRKHCQVSSKSSACVRCPNHVRLH